MKIKFPWTRPADEDLAQIESLLSLTLTPVSPRDGFTSELQQRLESTMPVIVAPATETKQIGQNWTFWGLMTLVGSLLLVLTGFRFYAAVLGALGIIGGLSGRPDKDKQASSLNPVV